MLFYKYGGEHFGVTNFMSHFSMFVSTKAGIKVANENTGNAQVIGIILCRFPKCIITFPVGPVYYFLGHTSNTILLGTLKFYIGFEKVTPGTLEHLALIISRSTKCLDVFIFYPTSDT